MAIEVPMKAGDVVVFTEALTHGTAAWQGPTATADTALQVLPRQLGMVARGVAERSGRGVHATATVAAAATIGRQSPAAAVITHLFVYGTLRPGQERWPHLAPFVVDQGHDDTVPGALYDTGNGYPAARFDRAGTIHGRVYSLHVDRLDEALHSSTRSRVP